MKLNCKDPDTNRAAWTNFGLLPFESFSIPLLPKNTSENSSLVSVLCAQCHRQVWKTSQWSGTAPTIKLMQKQWE